MRLWHSHIRTLIVGIAHALPLLAKTACEGGLRPAHSWSIVSHEGYWTSFLSRQTQSWISAGLRDQQRPSASSVGGSQERPCRPMPSRCTAKHGRDDWQHQRRSVCVGERTRGPPRNLPQCVPRLRSRHSGGAPCG